MIVTDIFYPEQCLFCGAWGERVCPDCASGFQPVPEPRCRVCLHPIDPAVVGAATYIICGQCEKRPRYFRSLFAPFIYHGPVKEYLHRLKYGRDYSLIPYYLRLFRTAVLPWLGNVSYDWVVPVPFDNRHWRQRGFNIVRQMAERIDAANTRDVLRRTRDIRPQSGLTFPERIRNPQQAYACEELLPDKTALLVDDVFTTGATMNECARMLLQAGCREVYALTFARSILT